MVPDGADELRGNGKGFGWEDKREREIEASLSRRLAISNPIDVAACKEEDKMAVGERTEDERQKGGFALTKRGDRATDSIAYRFPRTQRLPNRFETILMVG